MSNSSGPVQQSLRLLSLDVLRGIAVLGILVMNIYAFAMPFPAYSNPLVMGGTEAHNMAIWYFTHILFDQKFMSIFSMLFGAGIVLMAGRAEERGAAFGGVFYRRQFWLLLIGLVHAYFIWYGDILFFYALVGMLAYRFRKRSVRSLLIIACVILPVAPLFTYAGGSYMVDLQARADSYVERQGSGETLSDDEQEAVDEWSEARVELLPGPAEVDQNLQAYLGSYTDAFAERWPFLLSFQSEGLFFFILWRVGGLMLIGMALMKLGILSAGGSCHFYKRLLLISYGLGLPLSVYSAWSQNAHAFEALWQFRVGGLANYLASILVALGHIALVMLIVKAGALARLMRRFAAVGQMALSNYLLHSLVMTSLFYGYGLGLYGQVPRLWQMALVAGMIGLQLVLSPWWLARYCFGPVEWLWRSLTYRKPQAMRRVA